MAHTLVCSPPLSRRSNTSDIFLVDKTQPSWAFRLVNVSLQWSQFTVVPFCKTFTSVTCFSSQKCVTVILWADWTRDSLLPWGCCTQPLHWLPLGFRFRIVHPVSFPKTLYNMKLSSPVSFWYKDHWWLISPTFTRFFFHCHQYLKQTLHFGSYLISSSGETTNPKKQLTKIQQDISLISHKEQPIMSKNINSTRVNPKMFNGNDKI